MYTINFYSYCIRTWINSCCLTHTNRPSKVFWGVIFIFFNTIDIEILRRTLKEFKCKELFEKSMGRQWGKISRILFLCTSINIRCTYFQNFCHRLKAVKISWKLKTQLHRNNNATSEDIVQRRRRWGACAPPPSFGISVNPIWTKGGRLCPPYYYCTLYAIYLST